MKSPLIVSLLALALSVVALAIALMDLSSPAPHEGAPALRTDAAPGSGSSARVQALGEEIRELRNQLAMLEVRPAPVQRTLATDDFASREEFDALRDELRAALARPGPEAAVALGETPSPEFVDHVSKALSAIRRQENIESTKRWVATRSARLKKELPDIAAQLGLSYYQMDALESALVGLYQRQADLKLSAAEGKGDRSTVGETWSADLQAFQNELGGFLTSEQLQLYSGLKGDLFPGGTGGGK